MNQRNSTVAADTLVDSRHHKYRSPACRYTSSWRTLWRLINRSQYGKVIPANKIHNTDQSFDIWVIQPWYHGYGRSLRRFSEDAGGPKSTDSYWPNSLRYLDHGNRQLRTTSTFWPLLITGQSLFSERIFASARLPRAVANLLSSSLCDAGDQKVPGRWRSQNVFWSEFWPVKFSPVDIFAFIYVHERDL